MADIIDIFKERERALDNAVSVLETGDVVALPTETVYGLAGDAASGHGVARIFEAKGRPRFNPLICHVTDAGMAARYVAIDPLAGKLMDAFWPGPLTLVLPLLPEAGVHPLVTAGLGTLAVRAPQGFAATLIARLGRPLAAPSANSSGRISATTAAHVADDLGGRIPLILDGGPCPVGVESTIVRVDSERLYLLRPGGIASEAIEDVAGVRLERPGAAGIQAPGMMVSHYAPAARMRLDAQSVLPGEALLAFGPEKIEGQDEARIVLNLSPAGDLREAATHLFSFLKKADAAGADTIAVARIPDHGLGEAINDRLRRAAAPRD